MARGEGLYNTNCGTCHKADGSGIPPAFPALAGSPVATGDPIKHIEIVINGVSGTPMSAWGGQLNDLEIAAIVTYERNAWGNDTGDVVQPADVKAAR
jgi:cytochrome c oxidase subunit II